MIKGMSVAFKNKKIEESEDESFSIITSSENSSENDSDKDQEDSKDHPKASAINPERKKTKAIKQSVLDIENME